MENGYSWVERLNPTINVLRVVSATLQVGGRTVLAPGAARLGNWNPHPGFFFSFWWGCLGAGRWALIHTGGQQKYVPEQGSMGVMRMTRRGQDDCKTVSEAHVTIFFWNPNLYSARVQQRYRSGHVLLRNAIMNVHFWKEPA